LDDEDPEDRPGIPDDDPDDPELVDTTSPGERAKRAARVRERERESVRARTLSGAR
jgi:hypothetical protein